MSSTEYGEWDEDNLEQEREIQNVAGFCNRLKEAWKLCPNMTLGDFIDLAIPTSIFDSNADELIELLDEFIHQNQ